MSSSKHLGGVAVLAAAFVLAVVCNEISAAQGVSPQVARQIQALRAEKASWTHSESKVSSKLLMEGKRRLGRSMTAGLPQLRPLTGIDANGCMEVDIKAKVSPALLKRIETLRGKVINSFAELDAIRAKLPVEQVLVLAGDDSVKSIQPALGYLLNKADTSEGDVAHRANLARAAYAADGSGVAVGVLSDSIESLAALQASGDLPATVNVISGQSGTGTSEGTAMLEIVHDLAPGASLWFATANGGQAQFAANIRALAAAGCKVIVDDVSYLAEPVFQDGVIAQAVDEVAAAGVSYFSSAGNSGNFADGTSGVWEGDYVPMQIPSALTGWGSTAHAFDMGVNHIHITVDSPSYFTLKWSDPAGASSSDYDLFLLDEWCQTLYDCSFSRQTGSSDPFESIQSSFVDTGCTLVVVNYNDSPVRMLHLNANRGCLGGGTTGQIYGHAAAAGCVAVAAVDAGSAGGAGGVFNGTESVETFSSDGPRRVHFTAAGDPITPGDLSSTGGTLRQKPDIAAADGVSTATPGFKPFYGTSAAAPHAAAIAALMIDHNPPITPAAIRQQMADTAYDIEAAGTDRDAGAGLFDAHAALDMDITPPTGTILINNNKLATKSVNVALSLTWDDAGGSGVTRMRFSDNGSTWTPWETLKYTRTHALPAGDGYKTVRVQYLDIAGNRSLVYNDYIRLDTVPPAGAILINGGAASTTSLNVALNLTWADVGGGVTRMRFSDNGSTWTAWEALRHTKTHTLPAGLGYHTVRVQYTDIAENYSPIYNDYIKVVAP